MSAAALSRDRFAPQAPPGMRSGFAFAVLAHALLIAALAWSVNWHRSEPEGVVAELWSALPQTAAPRPPPAPRVAPTEPQPVQPVRPTRPPPRAAPPPEPAATAREDAQIAVERVARERARREQAERTEAARQADIARRQDASRADAQRRQAEREAEAKRSQQAADEKRRAAERAQRNERDVAAQRARAATAELQQRAERAQRAERERQVADAQAKKVQIAAEARRREAQQEDAAREEARRNVLRRMTAKAGAGDDASTGSAARPSGPSAGYAGRIKARIKPNVVLTGSVVGNPVAIVEVKLAPDGTIVGRKLVKSSGSALWDETVLRAIDRTEVLPKDTDGSVPPTMQIEFKPQE